MAVLTFTVKVHISCCSTCPKTAEKQLQKIKGVNSITIDTANDLVMVSGRVEPNVILEKFEKWGKKAELLSFQKEPMECDDHDDDENYKTKFNKSSYGTSGSNPGAVPTNRVFHDHNPNMYVPREYCNKSNWCWLGKKIFGNKARATLAAKKAAPTDIMWQAPRIPMMEFGSPQPFYGGPSPMNQFGFSRPPMYGIPRPHPMYMPRPPMMLPYGGRLPGPAAAPMHAFNPMMHYTSYEDNYRHW